jgi:hypothetical protein
VSLCVFRASLNKTKAIVTETGSSNAETILPKPIPVSGNPAFISSGGIIVPNKGLLPILEKFQS